MWELVTGGHTCALPFYCSLGRLVLGSVAVALPPAKSILFRLFRRSETVERPHDPRITAFSALIANDGSYVPAEIDAEKDVALPQYTGGTTGRPTGAKPTHQNLSAHARKVNMLAPRSEEHTSELQALMPKPYADLCSQKTKDK